MRFSCFLFIVILLFPSCYKSRPTSLTVEVRNSAGQIVTGVLVKVRAEPTANLEGQELLIDYEGVAVVVASVQQNNLYGSEVIEIVEEIDNRLDLVIQ